MRPAIMARNAHLNLRVRPPLKAELAKLATKIGAFSAPMLKGVLEDYLAKLKGRKPKP
jgi:hypothetical protein